MSHHPNKLTSLLFILTIWLPPSESVVAQSQRRRTAERPATIRGVLSYPSEGLPPEMVVCAENLKTANVLCKGTDDRDRQYDTKYELVIPPGSYFIFATLPYDAEDNSDVPPSQRMYRAYYSEYVRCMKVNPSRNPEECPSHAPIRVTVRSGQTVSSIDPGDWYNH